MRVLLIGGTGCLSSAIARLLVQKGFFVSVINRGNRKPVEGCECIKANCFDYPFVEQKLNGRKFDAVIDFLCYTKEQLERSFSLYSKFSDQYVFISSCAVYNTSLGEPCTEDSPKELKIWQYSVDKWACECRLQELSKNCSCRCTIIRPAVTYGDTRIPYGITPPYGYHWTLVARVLSGKPLIRWRGGATRGNMMRVEEFAVGVVGLVCNRLAYGEAYNICGDECPSFNDVLSAMGDAIGKSPAVVDVTSEFYASEIPDRAGEILGGRSIDSRMVNEKIKKIVPEFAQKTLLKEGVRKTVEAYRRQNYQRGIDWTFDAMTDRIIQKWCKTKGLSTKGMHLGFVDYLGSATLRDRLRYYVAFYSETPGMIFLRRMRRFVKRFV